MEIMDEKVGLYRPRAGISNPEGSIFQTLPLRKDQWRFFFSSSLYTKTDKM
jgi:hypothetical protein